LLGVVLIGVAYWFLHSGTLSRLGVIASEQIKWESNYEAAFERAEAENKPVLIVFFEPESRFYHRLEMYTFSNETVVRTLNKKAVCVRLLKQDNEELYQLYGGTKLPLVIWHEAKGPEVFRFIGYRPPEAFLNTMPESRSR